MSDQKMLSDQKMMNEIILLVIGILGDGTTIAECKRVTRLFFHMIQEEVAKLDKERGNKMFRIAQFLGMEGNHDENLVSEIGDWRKAFDKLSNFLEMNCYGIDKVVDKAIERMEAGK